MSLITKPYKIENLLNIYNSVLAPKATRAVKTFRDENTSPIWIGVRSNDSFPDFYFLNGEQMSDAEMRFKWQGGEGIPPYRTKTAEWYRCGLEVNNLFKQAYSKINPY